MSGSKLHNESNFTRIENTRPVADAKKVVTTFLSYLSCNTTEKVMHFLSAVLGLYVSWLVLNDGKSTLTNSVMAMCTDNGNGAPTYKCNLYASLTGFVMAMLICVAVLMLSMAVAHGLSVLHRQITGDDLHDHTGCDDAKFHGCAKAGIGLLALVVYALMSIAVFIGHVFMPVPAPTASPTNWLTGPAQSSYNQLYPSYDSPFQRYNESFPHADSSPSTTDSDNVVVPQDNTYPVPAPDGTLCYNDVERYDAKYTGTCAMK